MRTDSPRQIDVAKRIDGAPMGTIQIRVVCMTLLIAILEGFDIQVIAFVAPQIATDWTVDRSAFGPVFSASLLGLMIGAFFLGFAGDRFGRKLVAMGSFGSVGFFTLLTALADTMTELIVLRFLTGIGLGGTIPNAIALVSEYAPKRYRATAVTVMMCGFPLGAAVGGMVVAPLIPMFGWQAAFVIGGVMPLVLSIFIVYLMPESIRFLALQNKTRNEAIHLLSRIDSSYRPRTEDQLLLFNERSKSAPIVQLFTEGRATGTLLIWLLFLFNLLMLYLMLNWLPTILMDVGLPLERAIVATATFNLGGMLAGVALGRFVDRNARYGAITLAYVGAAAITATMSTSPTSVMAIFGLTFLAGSTILGPQMALNAIAANAYPTPIRSGGVGAALAVGRIGAIIGPLAGGATLALGVAGTKMFLLLVIPALVCAFAIFLLGRRS